MNQHPHRDAAATPPRRAGPVAVVLALSLLSAAPVGAEDPRPDARRRPPMWTTEPVRVDRSKETRERLEPSHGPPRAPAIVIEGDGRLREGTVIVAGTRRLRLHGLGAIDPARICVDDGGRRWACGIRARAALSAAVAGRLLLCRPVGPQTGPDPVVDCLMRGASLSLTLVEDGWAELDEAGAADPVLAEASARAAREHRGVWARQAPP